MEENFEKDFQTKKTTRNMLVKLILDRSTWLRDIGIYMSTRRTPRTTAMTVVTM